MAQNNSPDAGKKQSRRKKAEKLTIALNRYHA